LRSSAETVGAAANNEAAETALNSRKVRQQAIIHAFHAANPARPFRYSLSQKIAERSVRCSTTMIAASFG
jgi:hypothetical protein